MFFVVIVPFGVIHAFIITLLAIFLAIMMNIKMIVYRFWKCHFFCPINFLLAGCKVYLFTSYSIYVVILKVMNSQYQKISPTLLVIDNDPSTAAVFKKLLEAKDYNVLTTNSSKESLGIIQRVMLDLIILDLLMPEMDGWELCKAIREMTRTPILIISAIESSEIITKTLNLGADDYLVKPVSSYTLIAHVKNLVRRYKTEELALPENQ